MVVVKLFQIHVVNSDFESQNEFHAESVEGAARQALRAALDLGTDEVCKGTRFFGAEVRVELDGELQQRFVIGIGQSPLQ